MRILFLGDVVGISGCSKLTKSLLGEIKSKEIDFVIVNGENAAEEGVGLTSDICQDFFIISWKNICGTDKHASKMNIFLITISSRANNPFS